MLVCSFCKFLNIKHCKCRICYRLSKYRPRIFLKCGIKLLIGTVRVNKCNIYSHFFHRNRKQIKCSAIYRR